MVALAKKQISSVSPSAEKNPSVVAQYAVLRDKFMYEFALHKEGQLSFKKKLEQLMKHKRWSRKQLAEEAGLEVNVINRIITGETSSPKVETIISLSLAMQLPSKTRDELFRLAGRTWDDSDEHFAYRYILDNATLFVERGEFMTASDFNDAFNALGIEDLSPYPLPDRYRH
jgi:transcriptional regulator with XRE-family HTH domain